MFLTCTARDVQFCVLVLWNHSSVCACVCAKNWCGKYD